MEKKYSPFFSVVIPTYNCADFLDRALKSVFDQTYPNYEIIVIDNSSTDHTRNILDKYSNERLKVYRLNNNGNIALSRNKGITYAKGKWIAFLDSDDTWYSKKLETVFNEIENSPDAILFCHNENHVVGNKIKKSLSYGPGGKKINEYLLFNGNCLSTSAVCIKTTIAKKTNGFSERSDFITAEDYEYWIRLSNYGNFSFIKQILGEWHTHNNNYSGNPKTHANATIAVLEFHLINRQENHKDISRKISKARSRAYSNGARMFQVSKMFEDATRYAFQALKYNPINIKAFFIIILSLLKINKP